MLSTPEYLLCVYLYIYFEVYIIKMLFTSGKLFFSVSDKIFVKFNKMSNLTNATLNRMSTWCMHMCYVATFVLSNERRALSKNQTRHNSSKQQCSGLGGDSRLTQSRGRTLLAVHVKPSNYPNRHKNTYLVILETPLAIQQTKMAVPRGKL